jgi:hypothetical protein
VRRIGADRAGIEVVEDGRRFVFQFPLTACAATPNVAAP